MSKSLEHVSRRTLLKGLAVAALTSQTASAASACSTTAIPLVRIRLRREPFPFDPAEWFNQDYEYIFRAIYAPLSRLKDGGWVPYLAEDIVEDHDTTAARPRWRITIRLQPWTRWSGPHERNISTEDINLTIRRLRDAGLAVWQDVEDVTVVDDRVVTLVLKRKNVALWRDAFPRVVSSVTRDGERIDQTNMASGEASGPYQVESWSPNDSTQLVCRGDWHGMPSIIKRVQFVVIPDTAVALAQFRARKIDIVNVTSEKVGSQQQRFTDQFQDGFLEVRSSARISYVGMDTRDGETQDQNAREAVMAALNQTEILRAGYGDDGAAPAFGVVPKQFLGALDQPYVTDQATGNLDLSKQKLSDAGLASGFATDLWIPPWLGDPGRRMAEAIQNQLRAVGIDVTPRIRQTGAQWFDLFFGPRGLFLEQTSNSYDPSSSLMEFQSKSRFNTTGFENGEFDSLFQNSFTIDGGERVEVLQMAQQILLSEAAIVPIAQPNEFWLIRDDLVRPSFAPDGQLGDLIDFEPVQ